jgi:hypothetical protein
MTDLILPRRQFAAPAIVRADSLMKVVAPQRQRIYALTDDQLLVWPPLKLGPPLIDIELPGPHNPSLWLVSWGNETDGQVYPAHPSGGGKSII